MMLRLMRSPLGRVRMIVRVCRMLVRRVIMLRVLTLRVSRVIAMRVE